MQNGRGTAGFRFTENKTQTIDLLKHMLSRTIIPVSHITGRAMKTGIFAFTNAIRSHKKTALEVAQALGVTEKAISNRADQASEDFRRIHLKTRITAAGFLWLAMAHNEAQEAIAIKMASREKLDDGEWEMKRKRAISLRNSGASISQIAEATSASTSAVGRWVKGTKAASRAPREASQINRAMELRAKGYSVRQIAEVVGAPSSTVHRWIKSEK